jgi:hypothetical protein
MSSSSIIMTAAQCRAARALIEWTPEKLSETSGVELQAINVFESRFHRPSDPDKSRLRTALEHAGVVFISENGGGAGVRLKFNHREVRAINSWEGEGGTPGEDDLL